MLMQIISYACNRQQLSNLKSWGASEVILAGSDFSRFGRIPLPDMEELAREAKNMGLRTVFEWDILMTENVLQQKKILLSQIDLNNFDAFRLQDFGTLEYILKNFKQPIQFVAESGNHNIHALSRIEHYAGNRLERFALSCELPLHSLQEISKHMATPCEVLGLGPILLFYSPRSLLSPLTSGEEIAHHKAQELGALEATAKSEETPHKGFMIMQNSHGTFMLYPKDLGLLGVTSELKSAGIKFFRADMRYHRPFEFLQKVFHFFAHGGDGNALLKEYPRPCIKGFFHINRSDSVLPKLKNAHRQERHENYLGDILDVRKKDIMALHLIHSTEQLKVGDKIMIRTPEGKEKLMTISILQDLARSQITGPCNNQVVLLPHVSGVSIRSQVFKCH